MLHWTDLLFLVILVFSSHVLLAFNPVCKYVYTLVREARKLVCSTISAELDDENIRFHVAMVGIKYYT